MHDAGVGRHHAEVAEGGLAPLKIPHMGWNAISVRKPSQLLEGLADACYMYFVHSYYVAPDHDDVVCTMTDYGGSFVSSIARDNIFGCQFHPEFKSKPLAPHPLFASFIRAAVDQSRDVLQRAIALLLLEQDTITHAMLQSEPPAARTRCASPGPITA